MRSFDSVGKASSAVILDFPVRAAAADRLRARRQSRQPAMQAMPVAYEDGWYHEEAIREDRMRRER